MFLTDAFDNVASIYTDSNFDTELSSVVAEDVSPSPPIDSMGYGRLSSTDNVASNCTDSEYDTHDMIVGMKSGTVEDVSHFPQSSFSGNNEVGKTSSKITSVDAESTKPLVSQSLYSGNPAAVFL